MSIRTNVTFRKDILAVLERVVDKVHLGTSLCFFWVDGWISLTLFSYTVVGEVGGAIIIKEETFGVSVGVSSSILIWVVTIEVVLEEKLIGESSLECGGESPT